MLALDIRHTTPPLLLNDHDTFLHLLTSWEAWWMIYILVLSTRSHMLS